jgi:hypothetical protein
LRSPHKQSFLRRTNKPDQAGSYPVNIYTPFCSFGNNGK